MQVFVHAKLCWDPCKPGLTVEPTVYKVSRNQYQDSQSHTSTAWKRVMSRNNFKKIDASREMFEIATKIFYKSVSTIPSIRTPHFCPGANPKTFLICHCRHGHVLFPNALYYFYIWYKVPRVLYLAVKLFLLVIADFHWTFAIEEMFPILSLPFMQTGITRPQYPCYLICISMWPGEQTADTFLIMNKLHSKQLFLLKTEFTVAFWK